MKLGAMLVRDKRLTSAQIDQAVAQQTRVGGRLGTVMVEMRLVDADTLTVYLGLELGIPIATRAALERAKRAAVRCLSPELAERFLCVPLVVQDRQLIAAMRDPHDLLALDELAAATGHRIIPRVAPEVRLYYYVERFYGVPRPERFRRLGDAAIAGATRGADFVEPPPPPLPGLPPPNRTATPAGAAPPLMIRAISAQPAVPSVPEPEDDLANEMMRGDDEPAEPAPEVRTLPSVPAAIPVSATSPTEEMLTIPVALARMEAAASRAEIAEAIIGYARSLFDVTALFVVRDELAFGWKGFGHELDVDRIETLLIPLDANSMFKTAVEGDDLFTGPAPPSALHAHLYKVLRTSAPRQAVVVPITIRERKVNILYGHRVGDRDVPAQDLDGLRQLARAASAAYVRLIALQKQGG